MKMHNSKMRVSVLAFAVEGALIAMCTMPAHADDEEAAALKTPTNSVEIGVLNTSRSAAKFGQYTGLNKSGVDLEGNFSVRGGDAYGDGNGTTRWGVTGTDLGLTSRSLDAAMSNQGQWSLGIGYDELRHNLTDTYQTPYQGSMGGNSFVLPSGFGTTSNTVTSLSAGQQASFQTVDIGTTRKNTSLTAGYNLNSQWDIKFDYNHLDQSGAKLMGFGSMANGTTTGEAVSILPNPTNYKTDTLNLALNWASDKEHWTLSYFGSFFREGYDRVTFQTFAGANSIQTMSTPPSNDFHQLNLTGGYAFSAKMKLTGGLSYGRNTQSDAFVVDSFMMVTPAPQSSLDGLVVTSHADLKLTDQTIKDLALTAGIKYDKRDNRTASNLYKFNALDGSASHVANFPNTPYSNSKTQLELAGDYRLDKGQHVRLAYNRENVSRWCDQYAVGGSGAYVSGQNYNNYPAGTNCVVATASKDDKLSATYKLKANDDVNMNVGYAYSKRITDSDPNAITARIGTNGNIDPTAAASTLVWGQNAGDFRGFYPFFDASRKEQMLKAGVNWQADDKLSLGLNGRYTDDNYDSTYGVQNGNTWSLNLDAAYSYSENGSVSAYLTQEHRQRDLTDKQNAAAVTATATRLSVPANSTWTDKLNDEDITIGLGVKQGGLVGGKLELAGDLTYSLGKTVYSTQLNYAGLTSGTPQLDCSAPSLLSCGQLPDIKNTMTQFKLTGTYQVDKSAKVALGYIFQQLKSNDYYYNGLQYGYTPNALMPTNQQSGSYSVNVLTATYIYSFK